MSDATCEAMTESANGEHGGERTRGVFRAIAKNPAAELRRLVIAAAASLPVRRSWWA
jgi:hypothetical protein